jgi:three-Cys-motif partner protein
MSSDFHSQAFSDGTKLKLYVFRKYIREWIPVFITDSSKQDHISSINIFDLFSGPGADVAGTPDSPVIIVDEINKYCKAKGISKSRKIIRIYFNDQKADKIKELEAALQESSFGNDFCEVLLTSKPFDKIASLKEFVGGFWFGQVAKSMI